MVKLLAAAALVVALPAAFAAADTSQYHVKHISGPRGGHHVVRLDRSQMDRPAYALTGETEREPTRTPRALRFIGPRHNQIWTGVDR